MRSYRGLSIKWIVNNKEWQELRKSLVDTWKVTPRVNCLLLSKYLDSHEHDKLAYVRVYNYLTGSGFRSKTINYPCVRRLKRHVKSVLLNW